MRPPTNFHGVEPSDIETGKSCSSSNGKPCAFVHAGFRGFAHAPCRTQSQSRRHHRGHDLRDRSRAIFAEPFREVLSTSGLPSNMPLHSRRDSLPKVLMVAVYSTFLQRAYDQVVHDIAVQGFPVRFAIDRAGWSAPTADPCRAPSTWPFSPACRARWSWRPPTRSSSCIWSRPPPPSMTVPPPSAIRAGGTGLAFACAAAPASDRQGTELLARGLCRGLALLFGARLQECSKPPSSPASDCRNRRR